MILRRVFGRAPEPADHARIPDGGRVYAVGDIHGRSDLLLVVRELIAADCRQGSWSSVTTVFLGDYVDRGSDSRGVLRVLADEPFPTQTIFLKGNHEAMMLAFLADAERWTGWLANGGVETLRSYGVPVRDLRRPGGPAEAARRLQEALPASHRNFLGNLQLSYSVGDYFFCHAGVRPGLPLDRQVEEDLIWIREDFLLSSAAFGKVVVHGHTPVQEPEVLPNRVNLDTGAYISGRLTCLVLEGATRRFLVADAAGARSSQDIA